MRLPKLQWKVDAFPTVMKTLLLIILSISRVFAFCPSQCQCNDLLLRASCVYARLDVVPILLNPAIQVLDLSHNRIAAVQQSLEFYIDLRSLNLSYNAISSLGSKQLEALPALGFLNLSYNAIQDLNEPGVFSGLPNLRVLDISYNRIKFTGNVFDGLSSLETLLLTGNGMTMLHSEALIDLKKLQILNINYNRLQTLPDFGTLYELRELNINHNSVAVLDGGLFSSQLWLVLLSFRNNSLHIIHPDAFVGLEKLRVLDLSYNRLESVLDVSLYPLISIESLDLSGNFFTQMDGSLFGNLKTLNTLVLSYNPSLQIISDSGWNVNNSLKTLVVSHNRMLKSFPTSVLLKLKYLTELNLGYNALNSFQECSLVHLNLLDLGGNPFHCNCSAFWLWKLYHSSNTSRAIFGDITCAYPIVLRGRSLFELQDNNLMCLAPNEIILLSLCAGVGVMLVVTCVALCCWKKSRSKNEPRHSSRPQFKMLPFSTSINYHAESSTLAANGEFLYNTSHSSKRVPVTAV